MLTLEECLEKPKKPVGYSIRLFDKPAADAVPANYKTCKGSRLSVDAKGNVSYRNPDCIREWKPGSNPFHMAKLKPRNDGSAATFERLKEHITKRSDRQSASYVGRPVLDGYCFVATDGHRALLSRGPCTGEYSEVFRKDWNASRCVATIREPEFHLAVKRAGVMCPESKVFSLDASESTLIVSSEDPDCGTFDESLRIASNEPWSVSLNQAYMELVCGTWSLEVYFQSDEHPVFFCPVSKDWIYVVMPVRL